MNFDLPDSGSNSFFFVMPGKFYHLNVLIVGHIESNLQPKIRLSEPLLTTQTKVIKTISGNEYPFQ